MGDNLFSTIRRPRELGPASAAAPAPAPAPAPASPPQPPPPQSAQNLLTSIRKNEQGHLDAIGKSSRTPRRVTEVANETNNNANITESVMRRDIAGPELKYNNIDLSIIIEHAFEIPETKEVYVVTTDSIYKLERPVGTAYKLTKLNMTHRQWESESESVETHEIQEWLRNHNAEKVLECKKQEGGSRKTRKHRRQRKQRKSRKQRK